ncbi:MAG TPA: motility protein A [Bacillota bacterium]|nr:motility protein A [Bacillota bacterium]HOL10017.1 motility protein A [Bacillota bacterium]HPO97767.1 motility protein A [Bacillota bacterium]
METLIGVVGGLIVVAIGIMLNGSLLGFVDYPSMFITFGGSAMALLVNYQFSQFIGAFKAMMLLFKKDESDVERVLEEIVEYAKKARREGLLALEDEVQKSDDEFLKKGIQLIVDGTDPELVRSILEIELSFMEERHQTNKSFFESWGALAPGFGMIGTVIGLIQMLANLEDVSKIGPSMAVALITTFYGALFANLICTPIAGKLAIRSSNEQFLKQLMIEGILSIQAGENPRIVEEKLTAFLSPSQRNALKAKQETKVGDERERVNSVA